MLQRLPMMGGLGKTTLLADLLVEITRLARAGSFDYLLIESSGISEPQPVAETFSFADQAGAALGDVVRLDTMVTAVDVLTDAELAAGPAEWADLADPLPEWQLSELQA